MLAVDTETTGLTFFDGAFGASVASSKGARWFELPDESKSLCALLEVGEPLIFHNAKFDLQKLQLAGVLPRRKREVHDTEALAHLLDEHQPKRLKALTKKYLGIDVTENEELLAYVRKRSNGINRKRDGYSQVPRELLVPYALKDAEYTWALYEILYPMVEAMPDLLELYKMEMDLTWVLLDMEWDGLGVSESYVTDTIREYAGKILRAEWAIEDATQLKVWYPEKQGQKTPDGCFNPNSNPQVTEFYQAKGIRRDSYDKHALAEIDDDFARALLTLRSLRKMQNTYLIPMLNESKDGVLHPHFRQHGTVTGRMSAGKAED